MPFGCLVCFASTSERGARPRCPAGETARSVTRRDQRLAAARRRGGGNVTAHSKWQLDGRPGESPAAANNGSSRARSCRRVSCPRNRALRALHVKKNLADRSRTTSEHHDHQGSHLVGWPCMQQLVVTNLFYHHQVTTPGDNIRLWETSHVQQNRGLTWDAVS
ncbi:uncharacterized protein LOC142575860 isoform X5 [Dermacentor variabilis]|uniref:uncharacterized protein LOC142575860 isoform X5 n=1 Tax=Dermacentor variabilis TaxID=34621 RepID=UPI003F5C7701